MRLSRVKNAISQSSKTNQAQKEENPYASSDQPLQSQKNLTDVELRNHYIGSEVCVIAVGWFYYMISNFILGWSVGYIWLEKIDYTLLSYLALTCLGISAILFSLIGFGLRHFCLWSRLPSFLLSILLLLFMPLGTVAGAYCLFLLKKNTPTAVFSLKYKTLIAEDCKKNYAWISVPTGWLFAIFYWLGEHFFPSSKNFLDLLF